MIGNKEDIIEFVNNSKEKEFIIEEVNSKKWRTLAQNRWIYLLLSWISKHLWEDIHTVKIYLLSWCFWTRKLKLSKTEIEVPNISKTSLLSKEQAIFFIETIIQFCKIKNIPVEITPLELQTLYNNYN